MTGWRIGYIEHQNSSPKRVQKGQVNLANSIAQRATITAVDADPSV
jgi:aspartate aminotransferase